MKQLEWSPSRTDAQWLAAKAAENREINWENIAPYDFNPLDNMPHIRPCNCYKHRDDISYSPPVTHAAPQTVIKGHPHNNHVVDWLIVQGNAAHNIVVDRHLLPDPM